MSLILLGILNSQVTAAGGASSMELIETISVTTNVSTITLSNIPQDYKHLQIRAVLRNSSSYTYNTSKVRVTFNNDTNNNYSYHRLERYGNNSGVVSGSAYGGYANMEIMGCSGGSGAAYISAFMPNVVDILDYSSTNKNTTARSLHGDEINANRIISLRSGQWMNTAAVTSITLDDADWNFAGGSRVSLYGIRG